MVSRMVQACLRHKANFDSQTPRGNIVATTSCSQSDVQAATRRPQGITVHGSEAFINRLVFGCVTTNSGGTCESLAAGHCSSQRSRNSVTTAVAFCCMEIPLCSFPLQTNHLWPSPNRPAAKVLHCPSSCHPCSLTRRSGRCCVARRCHAQCCSSCGSCCVASSGSIASEYGWWRP